MLHYLVLMPVLYVFWLLLSGHYTAFFFGLGLVSVFIVIAFQRKMDRIDHEPARLKLSLGLFNYAGWLIWNLILSNLDVTRRIWDPKLPVSPVWDRLDVSVDTNHEKTLYANCITLTPGTLTTEVREDHFLVHTLSPESMQELKQGEMEKRIKQLGI